MLSGKSATTSVGRLTGALSRNRERKQPAPGRLRTKPRIRKFCFFDRYLQLTGGFLAIGFFCIRALLSSSIPCMYYRFFDLDVLTNHIPVSYRGTDDRNYHQLRCSIVSYSEEESTLNMTSV
jgi:hypothetical protein